MARSRRKVNQKTAKTASFRDIHSMTLDFGGSDKQHVEIVTPERVEEHKYVVADDDPIAEPLIVTLDVDAVIIEETLALPLKSSAAEKSFITLQAAAADSPVTLEPSVDDSTDIDIDNYIGVPTDETDELDDELVDPPCADHVFAASARIKVHVAEPSAVNDSASVTVQSEPNGEPLEPSAEESAAADDQEIEEEEEETDSDDDPAREYQRKCADINAAVGNQFFNPKGIAFDLKRLDHWHPAVNKVPAAEVDGKLINIGANDSRALLPFTDAAKLAVKHDCGIGFTLDAMTFPVVCVDIDHCLTDGKLNEIADAAIKTFEGKAYIEKSSSGSGLHIFFFDTDAAEISTKKPACGVEVYNCRRHIVVTGNALSSAESMSFAGGAELVLKHLCKADPNFIDQSLDAADRAALLNKHRFGVPDDDQINAILKRIEKWNNGGEILSLYHGSWQQIKNLDGSARFKSQSEADFKLLSAIAFATDCNVDAMEAIFKKSSLANREKAKRPDYLARTIAKIVLHSVKLPKPYKNPFDNETFVKEIESQLSRSTKGAPLAETSNYDLVFEYDLNLRNIIGYNAFTQRIVVRRKPLWRQHSLDCDSEGWKDSDDAALRNYISRTYHFRGASVFDDALDEHARRQSFHPVRDFFNSLPAWDHTPRVETLFIDLLGIEDTPYARAVTKHWLLAAVSRIFNPGCKFDYCLSLQGKQGIGKSTILSRLGGKWFSELDSIQGKDAIEALIGAWIVELTEMQATKRTENSQQKSFMSRSTDIVRLPYGHRSQEFRRQCVLAATTNEFEPLTDQTGGRRWWILKCNADKFNPNILSIDINQIWAEVFAIYHEFFADGFDSSKLDIPADIKFIAAQIQEANTTGGDMQSQIEAFLDLPMPPLDVWIHLTKSDRRRYCSEGRVFVDPQILPADIRNDPDVQTFIKTPESAAADQKRAYLIIDSRGDLRFGKMFRDENGNIRRRSTVTAAEIASEMLDIVNYRDKISTMTSINNCLQKLDGWQLKGQATKRDRYYGRPQKVFERIETPNTDTDAEVESAASSAVEPTEPFIVDETMIKSLAKLSSKQREQFFKEHSLSYAEIEVILRRVFVDADFNKHDFDPDVDDADIPF